MYSMAIGNKMARIWPKKNYGPGDGYTSTDGSDSIIQ